jgi:hypothetical protein
MMQLNIEEFNLATYSLLTDDSFISHNIYYHTKGLRL